MVVFFFCVVWLYGVSIVISLLFLFVRMFLFFGIWHVGYCVGELSWLSIYFLVYLLYLKVREPTYLYYYSLLVSKSLTCCLKPSTLFPDLYRPFPTPSVYRFVPKITVKSYFVVFSSPRFVFLSLVSVVIWVIVRVPEKLVINCWMKIDSSGWLSEEHRPIMTPRPVLGLMLRYD